MPGTVGWLALAPLLQGSSTRATRDTIAAVFRQTAYDRDYQQSIFLRLIAWLFQQLTALLRAARGSHIGRPIVLAALIIAAVLIVGRIAFVIATADRIGRTSRSGRLRQLDPWTQAQRLAAAGSYTDAAHALYAALLEGVAEREALRVHPSKTVGDYGRELRRRSSVLVPPFRDFSRLYEVVVYGVGSCDRERYERLHALASGMLGLRA
jgi:hypothetical protein